ncbi:EAL domain-containing protein [Solirubrobacter phytolaccae]|uniref:EAL domain-containing protein n=1 Tax=Solirubrobacter phytolaccae TaxID=1404360 RepID=A0A9X3NE72_9ACTN|nr:EAL domain-containing protein [Solirubrobacter phytolaccae]MDA0183277.1 EAL domain-containing protein [Solirubrobacter phytolaccae]
MVIVVAAGTPVLLAALAVLARALRRPDDRGAWLALGLAVLAQAIGAIWLAWPGGGSTFPAHADYVLLLFFPLVFAAALLFARRRLKRLSAALWLDAAIGTLGAAAIVAQLLGETADRATGGGSDAVIALMYPMFDVLLVVMVLVAVTLRGWLVSPVWLLLGVGLMTHAGADVGYVSAGFVGEQRPLWVPVLGLISPVVIAVAAWSRTAEPRKVALEGWRTLVTPTVLALVAGGLLVTDHFNRTSTPAVLLAGATLVFVLVRMALTFVENTELHHSRALALTDELTGLANRRAFHEALREELAELGDGRLSVAMVDLDRFKDLNDTLGHHAGDQLLALLATRLEEAVGSSGLVARLGGDEFALLLPDAGLARTADVGRRIGSALQTPFEIDGLEVVMDASVGAALAPDHGTDAASLLQHADVAMYQAKEARTGFQSYDPSRDRHSRERLQLIAELRHALERDELILHYQPKVNLTTGLVDGVEALVRWQHPVHGLRGPGAFLPHAEHTALMRPLTLHVLETALRQLAEWRAEGLELHIAVNLAVQNLLDLRTPGQITAALQRHGLPPHVLTLEVTESLMLHDPQRAGEVLADLKELGVGLALDDFGTGYSSLEHLKRLPVNELKIDKSFVMAMDRDPADRAIVASTAALGRSLGLHVVAEGVESHAAASVLAAIGCDLAQGFYYSPPVPADQLPALVRAARDAQLGVIDVA